MTHDYKRNGTTSLFAAMNVLDGTIISQCQPRHRHQEWLRFLRIIDKLTPKDRQVHLIVDNYATHRHPAVRRWIDRRKRFHVHFTPTSCSWLNMVERFFRDLTEDVVREGSFGSVPELVRAMETYLAERNLTPKRYVWKKKGEEILAKISKARAAQAAAPQLWPLI